VVCPLHLTEIQPPRENDIHGVHSVYGGDARTVGLAAGSAPFTPRDRSDVDRCKLPHVSVDRPCSGERDGAWRRGSGAAMARWWLAPWLAATPHVCLSVARTCMYVLLRL
jgi:hypothetical protein